MTDHEWQLISKLRDELLLLSNELKAKGDKATAKKIGQITLRWFCAYQHSKHAAVKKKKVGA